MVMVLVLVLAPAPAPARSLWSRALLVCAFLLAASGEAPPPERRGLCAGGACYALFQEAEDLAGAERRCHAAGGQLPLFGSAELEKLLAGLDGSYWLTKMGDSKNCWAASAGRNVSIQAAPCGQKLSGFLCQFKLQQPCGRLPGRAGAQVQYTLLAGFQVKDWDLFPAGTFAVEGKVGADHPDSKHVCVSKTWHRAPWSCEVMQGGCAHSCDAPAKSCACPAGQVLHPNGFTCTEDACVRCAQRCVKEGDAHACRCDGGYRLAPDGHSCLDVDECAEEAGRCSGEEEECVNHEGGFNCTCRHGFVREEGACVDVRICKQCEHMRCKKVRGVYECECRGGFKVSPQDPTRCLLHCGEQECPAHCLMTEDLKKNKVLSCFCPDGYIRDNRNASAFCVDIDECVIKQQCDHRCQNFFGGFRCLCDHGFQLLDEHTCVPSTPKWTSTSTSTSTSATSTSTQSSTKAAGGGGKEANSLLAGVPSYIKTGSVLGITVFAALGLALMFFLVRSARRCGKLELSSLRADMDIFYLQQVTTETYKRLSFDKQMKNDSQRP